VPNSICYRCARADELSPEYNSAYIDFGRFLTGMLVVSGISHTGDAHHHEHPSMLLLPHVVTWAPRLTWSFPVAFPSLFAPSPLHPFILPIPVPFK
jgi:hypothetical protein